LFYPKQSDDYFTVRNKIYLVVDVFQRQLCDLGHKIGSILLPVFICNKLEQDRAMCCFSYFVCDLCDADYVGYTARHLFQRVAEHKNSAIGKQFHDAHCRSNLLNGSHFKILRKCQGKLDCLVFEVLYIKKFKPNLNVQRTLYVQKLFGFIVCSSS